MLAYFAIELSEDEKKWFGGDGKELKGSILRGDKRGEAIVQLVSHLDRVVVGESFYNGKKASEVPCVRTLLKKSKISTQKVSLDALHLKPKTLKLINESKGIYLIGLKKNQRELYQDMEKCTAYLEKKYSQQGIEKGHGRIDTRCYECYDVSGEYFDKRWEKSNIQTLIKVKRNRIILKTNQETSEISYYLSNMENKNMEQAQELFDAVRNHWQSEVINQLRDCTLKEDKLRCIDTDTNHTIATCRTLVLKLLAIDERQNNVEKLEYFSDHFDFCLNWLRRINFL